MKLGFQKLAMLAAIFSLLHCSAAVIAQVETEATQGLKKQGEQFKEKVLEVADGVYMSVGTSVSNVSMIVGTDGIVIIDTGMTHDSATKILAKFREVSDKPVKGIIFTHSHGDHTGGAAAFANGAEPQVWARSNFGSEQRPLKAAGLTIQLKRGQRQAGFALPMTMRINNGIAPARRPKRGASAFESGVNVKPTHFLGGESKIIEIAGVKLELHAAPGETADQLYVWYPAKKVLFAGDNFYRSFPNLYAIRGTQYRDVKAWADSVDQMLKHDPDVVVPGHTNPVIGAEKAQAMLGDYRDAIRFVHDKTVEGMNKGLTPDELVDYVQMPERLSKKPYLGEFYGNKDWAVKSVFNGYLGWFDGNPTNLFRLSPREEAAKIAELAGGPDFLLKKATAESDDGDPQWACQLCDYLIALNHKPAETKRVKANALTKLGVHCVTATGRNYYLTVAQELLEEIANDK